MSRVSFDRARLLVQADMKHGLSDACVRHRSRVLPSVQLADNSSIRLLAQKKEGVFDFNLDLCRIQDRILFLQLTCVHIEGILSYIVEQPEQLDPLV